MNRSVIDITGERLELLSRVGQRGPLFLQPGGADRKFFAVKDVVAFGSCEPLLEMMDLGWLLSEFTEEWRVNAVVIYVVFLCKGAFCVTELASSSTNRATGTPSTMR